MACMKVYGPVIFTRQLGWSELGEITHSHIKKNHVFVICNKYLKVFFSRKTGVSALRKGELFDKNLRTCIFILKGFSQEYSNETQSLGTIADQQSMVRYFPTQIWYLKKVKAVFIRHNTKTNYWQILQHCYPSLFMLSISRQNPQMDL